MPVALEIGFAGKALMKNLMTFYNIHVQILMRNRKMKTGLKKLRKLSVVLNKRFFEEVIGFFR